MWGLWDRWAKYVQIKTTLSCPFTPNPRHLTYLEQIR